MLNDNNNLNSYKANLNNYCQFVNKWLSAEKEIDAINNRIRNGKIVQLKVGSKIVDNCAISWGYNTCSGCATGACQTSENIYQDFTQPLSINEKDAAQRQLNELKKQQESLMSDDSYASYQRTTKIDLKVLCANFIKYLNGNDYTEKDLNQLIFFFKHMDLSTSPVLDFFKIYFGSPKKTRVFYHQVNFLLTTAKKNNLSLSEDFLLDITPEKYHMALLVCLDEVGKKNKNTLDVFLAKNKVDLGDEQKDAIEDLIYHTREAKQYISDDPQLHDDQYQDIRINLIDKLTSLISEPNATISVMNNCIVFFDDQDESTLIKLVDSMVNSNNHNFIKYCEKTEARVKDDGVSFLHQFFCSNGDNLLHIACQHATEAQLQKLITIGILSLHDKKNRNNQLPIDCLHKEDAEKFNQAISAHEEIVSIVEKAGFLGDFRLENYFSYLQENPSVVNFLAIFDLKMNLRDVDSYHELIGSFKERINDLLAVVANRIMADKGTYSAWKKKFSKFISPTVFLSDDPNDIFMEILNLYVVNNINIKVFNHIIDHINRRKLFNQIFEVADVSNRNYLFFEGKEPYITVKSNLNLFDRIDASKKAIIIAYLEKLTICYHIIYSVAKHYKMYHDYEKFIEVNQISQERRSLQKQEVNIKSTFSQDCHVLKFIVERTSDISDLLATYHQQNPRCKPSFIFTDLYPKARITDLAIQEFKEECYRGGCEGIDPQLFEEINIFPEQVVLLNIQRMATSPGPKTFKYFASIIERLCRVDFLSDTCKKEIVNTLTYVKAPLFKIFFAKRNGDLQLNSAFSQFKRDFENVIDINISLCLCYYRILNKEEYHSIFEQLIAAARNSERYASEDVHFNNFKEILNKNEGDHEFLKMLSIIKTKDDLKIAYSAFVNYLQFPEFQLGSGSKSPNFLKKLQSIISNEVENNVVRMGINFTVN